MRRRDDVSLWPWPLTLEVMAPVADAGCRPPSYTKLKFVGLAIRTILCTMCVSINRLCVSINRPGYPDLWPFDLETGMRIASKVGNLPSKFGHARPLGSRINRYVRDGRTDKATLIAPFPTGGDIITLTVWLLMKLLLINKAYSFWANVFSFHCCCYYCC